MTQSPASKLYALTMFLVVSVLCGLLTAGLMVPFVAMGAGSTKAAASGIDELPAVLNIPPQPEVSRILMADGSVLGTFYDQNRVYVPLKGISPIMRKSQVAIEDHRFYEHGAIDLQGVLRAVVRNSAGTSQQGGSTLTQQYVKQVLIQQAEINNDPKGVAAAQAPTYSRKIREMRYAIALEKKVSKDAILERYLNIAYYGDGAYGVEAAARHYFNSSAAKLTLPQAAMLAGLVQNPTATNPRLYPEAAVKRRNVVLQRMAELGVITQKEADAAKKTKWDPSQVRPAANGCLASPFPHICDYVRRTLVSDKMPSLGKTPAERMNRLKRGGLTIQTLIDRKTQLATEKSISAMVAPTDPVIATSVIIQPSTGLIVAMAQSRPKMGTGPGETFLNYNVEKAMGDAEGFQAGSTFKTFGIAAAIEKGMTPSKTYQAKKVLSLKGETFRNCEGTFVLNEKYDVSNSVRGYDDRTIDMVQAAQGSVNTYFLQLERDTGICAVTSMADKLGAKLANGKSMNTMASNPSYILGTAEVTPLSMAQAYATLANRGVRCDPVILKSVTNKAKKTFAVPESKCTKVIEPAVADGVSYVLSKVMVRPGTGARARIPGGWHQAGKTGTTESNEAVWFTGYTPEMAGIAMISVDKGTSYWKGRKRSLKRITLPSGTYLEGSGSGDAGDIYKVAMASALQGKPNTPFTKPSKTTMEGKKVMVPSVSGLGYEEAKKVLSAAGFTPVGSYQEYSSLPRGYYLGYAFPRGLQPMGSTIYLALSMGPRPQPKVQPKPQPQPQPTTQPTTAPTTTAPKPQPTTAAPQPTTAAPKPQPTTAAPKPTKPGKKP